MAQCGRTPHFMFLHTAPSQSKNKENFHNRSKHLIIDEGNEKRILFYHLRKTIGSWVLGNVEVVIRLIIVVKNKNCQAYHCVFSVFPASPLFRRFSIFSLLLFAFLFILVMAYLVFNSTASFWSVRAPHSPH